ncbi:MAG: tetratricopeptide repeat protein, partial [Flavobacteriales bacterium]|nr:tetratricopeptide repeat protein [Flavobacteriales bacterium]
MHHSPLLRAWAIALSMAATLLCAEARTQDHWAAFDEYLAIAQRNAAAELRVRAKEWIASDNPREGYLGHLAMATATLRDEDYPAALVLLDSLDNILPSAEFVMRATTRQLLSSTMTVLGDAARGGQVASDGVRMLPLKGYVPERLGLMLVQAEAMLMQGDLEGAHDIFSMIVGQAREAGILLDQANAESGLGLVRLNQGRFKEAYDIFNGALSLYRKTGNEMGMQNAVANMSLAATMDGQHALALGLCDSLLRELGSRTPEMRANLYLEKGVVHAGLNEHEKALEQYERVLLMRDSVAETIYLSVLSRHLASTYWALGRSADAFRCMEEAQRIADRLGQNGVRAEIHQVLHDWYFSLGRTTEALTHLQAHVSLSDPLNKARFSDQLARSEALYGTAKKEHRIAEQEQALRLAEAEHRRNALQRNMLIGAIVALAIIALLFYRTIWNRRRLATKEKELHHQQVDQLLSQQEIKSINAMLEGQETERERVAKDLHDRIGSMLGGIKANMSALEDRVEEMQHDQQYQKVSRLLDQAAGELRRISHDMAAATLSRFGLEKALRDLRDTIHINGRLHVELSTFGLDDRLE